MHRSRVLVMASLLSVFTLVAAACGDSSDEGGADATSAEPAVPLEDQKLVWGQFGAYTPKGFLEDFTAATGVEIEISKFVTNEDMLGKLQAGDGTGYDLVTVTGNYVQTLLDSGWVAPLDHAQIPNISNLYPEATQLAFDPGNVYTVPYTWGTTGLCYRTDLVNTAPTSWNDLLNPPAELQGKVTMLGTERWLLQPALLSLGYSINTEDLAQIEEAKQLTIAAKQNILQFNDTDFYVTLDEGNAGMVHAWDGWCNYATNKNVEFVVPSEGSDLFADNLAIMESSENKEAAHAFLNFVLEAENHLRVAELVLYKVPNAPAMELLDPALIKAYPNLGISPSELVANEEDLPLGAEAQAAWSQAAAEIKAA
jgi:spermidine/putrescine transport system substrate-binding protein